MFCESFEKIAVSPGLVQKAFQSRMAGALAKGGVPARSGVINEFINKTKNLNVAGKTESSGIRSAALRGVLSDNAKAQPSLNYSAPGFKPKSDSALRQQGSMGPKPPAPSANPFKLRSDILPQRPIPYSAIK